MTNPGAVIIPAAKALEAIPNSLHYLQALNLTPQTTTIIVCAGLLAAVLNHAIDTDTSVFADFNFRDGRFNFTLNKTFKEAES